MTANILIPTLAVTVLLAGCEKTDQSTDLDLSGTWVQVRPSQSGPFFHAVRFLDEVHGITVGDSGTVVRTSDGGNSWVQAPSGTTFDLLSLDFLANGTAWTAGERHTLGKSTDFGASWTWTSLGPDSTATLMTMSFSGLNHGWIGDNTGGIFHTTDGGSNWMPQNSGTNRAITSLHSVSQSVCYAISVHSTFLHTTNGGQSWDSISLDTILTAGSRTLMLTDIEVLPSGSVSVASNGAASSVMNPGGPILTWSPNTEKWSLVETPETLGLIALQYVDEQLGWAVGFDGIIRTTDGGRSWESQLPSSNSVFVDLHMTGQLRGWAITYSGVIYRYQRL